MSAEDQLLKQALWKIYNRPERPGPWQSGGNLPWNELSFSERMLHEHLDESHGAASRVSQERAKQLEWLWEKLELRPGQRLLDLTCGPGFYAIELARRGCHVVGVDFSPAAIAYARDLAKVEGVADQCRFLEQDVRQMTLGEGDFDAALFLYGQLAVFTKAEANALLTMIAGLLRPGGRLAVELLNQERVDKSRSSWWFTDRQGLWGNAPFLHLGERFWYAKEAISLERFHILHLETGQLDEITLCDQTYSVDQMSQMMGAAGFTAVQLYPAWDNLPLYDALEWHVYLSQR